MDESGKMNENAGKYQGLDRFACRKQIVAGFAGARYSVPYRRACASVWVIVSVVVRWSNLIYPPNGLSK